ncbi:MAG: KH domain-containing protein [Armatimonadetes bacterium]|nr:KH domain-containing protein [Armatimonadota bacterium]
MADETEVLDETAPAEQEPIAEVQMDELADDARDLFQEIISHLDVDAAVGIKAIDDRDIHLDADGDETGGGILIGRRGQTLEAIQLLIATIVGRKTDRRVRVFLDAFGYRERRAESLRQMALEVAEQVRSAGQEALTEPLSPAERRIIHTALVDVEGVATYSEGEEPNRYVVITPSDEGEEPNPESEA